MEPIIGSIMVFAGNFPPRGWAFCDGSILAIASNTALFSILGVTYGGNGTTTFALPDLRGRTPVNAGTGPGLTQRFLGESYGVENVTMLSANMPAHTHAVTGTVGIGANSAVNLAADTPVGNYLSATSDQAYAQSTNAVMGNSTVTPGQMTSVTGQGVPFNVIQPSLGLNYCIAIYGTYPARQ
ncbi:phage tail protein [Flavobacterium sp. 3HN19-14]|uniref:phage tail protein n=1 Tax=Flavobacterium sp. 3HN19-14 TaxID=3448133 RepID=UPI003EE180D3